MSSHREAPRISKDPAADNTDTYAFVDPVDHDKVTIIANYIPFQEPAGGPNFFTFDENVLYYINIDNDGDGWPDVRYLFHFRTEIVNLNTFLYNVGPISFNSGTGGYDNLIVDQTYSVARTQKGGSETWLASGIRTPPVNIGPRSTPDYASALVPPAIHNIGGGRMVFAGQRDDGFYVDLGSIFDLGALRPFQNLHLISTPATPGKDDLKGYNVSSIALQVPKADLTRGGVNPTDPLDPRSTVGIWASARRSRSRILHEGPEIPNSGGRVESNLGKSIQVSRLGNPLINEVIIPRGKKDFWNSQIPASDSQFKQYYEHPELQVLLPILYPGVFPNLASNPARPDLVAILLSGIPPGVVPGFANFTGETLSDELRLNLAIDPTYSNPNVPADSPKRLGLLGGDLDGFPNGRRVFDDVVDIELRAVAGATLPLVNPGYTADAAAGLLADRIPEPLNEVPFLTSFPYLGTPHVGFTHSHD